MLDEWELSRIIDLVTDEISRLRGTKFTLVEPLEVSALWVIIHKLEDMAEGL